MAKKLTLTQKRSLLKWTLEKLTPLINDFLAASEKKKNQRLLEVDIENIRKLQEEEQRKLESWIEQKEYIDTDNIAIRYKSYSDSVRDKILDLTIKSLAVVDGVQNVNDVLQAGLGMSHVAINLGDVTKAGRKIFKLELLQYILEQSNFTDDIKSKILISAITGEFDESGKSQKIN